MHQPHIPRDIGSITEPSLTQHACTRMQQRGIRKSDVELALQYVVASMQEALFSMSSGARKWRAGLP